MTSPELVLLNFQSYTNWYTVRTPCYGLLKYECTIEFKVTIVNFVVQYNLINLEITAKLQNSEKFHKFWKNAMSLNGAMSYTI